MSPENIEGIGGADAYALTKLVSTYLAILDDEWAELGDQDRRDLLVKAKDALARAVAELHRSHVDEDRA